MKANKEHDVNKTSFLFVLDSILSTNTNFYLALYLEGKTKIMSIFEISEFIKKFLQFKYINNLLSSNKIKLLYYINGVIDIHCLYISPSMLLYIFTITYKKKYGGFSYYYNIVICS